MTYTLNVDQHPVPLVDHPGSEAAQRLARHLGQSACKACTGAACTSRVRPGRSDRGLVFSFAEYWQRFRAVLHLLCEVQGEHDAQSYRGIVKLPG